MNFLGLTSPKIYHESICGICHDDYDLNKSNPCSLLKCGHIFHQACVEPWIISHQTCPVCKQRAIIPLSTNELLREWVKTELKEIKQSLLCMTLMTAPLAFVTLTVMVIYTALNFFFPGHLPATIEEYKEHFNQTQNNQTQSYEPACYKIEGNEIILFICMLGIIALSIGTSVACCSTIKRNQGSNLKRIDYIPPEQF